MKFFFDVGEYSSAENAERRSESCISLAFSQRVFLSVLCAKTSEIFIVSGYLVQVFFFLLGKNPFLFDVYAYEGIQAHVKICNPNE
jgi:hypothetical protein